MFSLHISRGVPGTGDARRHAIAARGFQHLADVPECARAAWLPRRPFVGAATAKAFSRAVERERDAGQTGEES